MKTTRHTPPDARSVRGPAMSPRLALLALALTLPAVARAGTYYKLDTATMNNTSGLDWTPSGVFGSGDTLSWQPGTGKAAITLGNSMSLVLGGPIACSNLLLQAGTTLPAATAIVINPDGNTLSLYSSSSAVNGAAIDQRNGVLSTVLNCPITLFNNVNIRNNGLGDLTIGGAIGESGGSRSVTFPGLDGWVNLSGANTYSGGTTVGAQTLLTLSGNGTLGNGTGGLTLGASIYGGWLDLGGTTQSVGSVNFGAGALVQNGTLNATAFSNYGVVGANLGGTGALTLNSAGNILVLSGNLSYTGGTTNTAGTILTTKPLPLSGKTVLGGTLAARVGGAGEWASTDFDNLLGSTNLIVNSGGTLGFDTTDGNFTYAHAISGPTPANLGLLKQGANTLTLSGANTYQKATTVKAGTLTLQGASGSLSASSPLTFTGSGTFNFDNVGASGTTAQSLGTLTLSGGEGTLLATRTANFDQALTFSSVAAHTAGGSGNFVTGGGVNGASNGFNVTGAGQGFLNQGLFFNGADYAYLDGAGTFVRAPVYGTDSGFSAANTLTPSTHVLLTSTPAAQNSLTLNTLKLAGSGVGFSLSSGQVLSLANGGILKAGGGSAASMSGGNVQTTDTSHDLVVRTDSASDALTIGSVLGAVVPSRTGSVTGGSATVTGISSTSDLYVGMVVYFNGGIANCFGVNTPWTTIASIGGLNQITLANAVNASAAPTGTYTLSFYGSSLTKSGAGTLTLTGANTLTAVNLNGGQLNINGTSALGIGTSATLTGGQQNNPPCKFTINEGTTIDNTSGSAISMIYKYKWQINGSFTFVGSSDLYFIDANGNGNITMPNDITLTTSTKGSTLRLGSNFGLTTGKLTKNGPGTLELGANGGLGLNGGLVLNEGVFAGTSSQADGTYSGPVTLGDATLGNSHVAILHFLNGGAHSAPVTVRAGSSGTLAMYGTVAPTLYGPMVLNNTLTLGAASGQTFSHYGVISGTGGLTIGNTNTFTVYGSPYSLTNSGTVALFNRNTYTGNTLVNSGTLKLGALGTLNNSPLLSLAAGTTLDVSATSNYILSANTTLSANGAGTTASTYARIVGPAASGVSLGAQPLILGFKPTSFTGDSAHPALYVSQGNLTLNNNPITVNNNSGTPLGAGTYTLIQLATGFTLTENASPAYPVTVGAPGLAPNSTATVANGGSGNLVMTVVTRDVTAFSNLTPSQTIQQGTASVTLSGLVADTNGLAAPAMGETVQIIINGVTNNTTTYDGNGDFTATIDTHLIPANAQPYTITYRYGGNASLLGCADTSTTLTVSSTTVPVVSSWPTSTAITYGDALSTAVLSGGYAYDPNTFAQVSGTFTFTTPATVPTAAGTYAASGTFTPDNTSSYSVVVQSGAISVTVNQRPTGLASPAVLTRAYDGTTAATITGTLTNLLAGDVGQVTLAGTGTFNSPAPDVGANIPVDASTLSLAGTKAPNYILTPPTGLTGTITQAVLSVTADHIVRPLGSTNPPLTYTVYGYQNGDTATSVGLTGNPGLSTTATSASPEGSYTIVCTNVNMTLTSGDYSLAFVNGTLQVVGLRTWAAGTGLWDIQTSTNWTSASGPAIYVDGGAVLFSDAAAGVGPYTVTLSTNVNPYTVTVSNLTKDYTLSGSGTRIGGMGSVTKLGNATLTLGMPNAYSGGTTVSAGTLQYGNKYAFGTGDITLAGGVTWRKITEEGNSALLATTNNIHLSGGSVTTDISRFTAKDMWLTGVIDGPGGLVVTNDGASRVLTLVNANTFGGGVRLLSGAARVSIQTVNSLGTGTLRCDLLAPASPANASIGGLINGGYDLSAGVTNAIDLAPGANLDIGWASSGNLLLSGPISDGGGLTFWGTGTLSLSGANNYGGATVVNNGTLEIVNATSLGSGPLVITNSHVQLDYSGTTKVTSLTLNGVAQTPGTYGATGSGAANINNTYFTGTGTVTVAPAGTITTITGSPVNGTNGYSVTLQATVVAQSPSLATVNEGTVTFTVTNSAGTIVTNVTSGVVAVNSASAGLSLANITAGVYGYTATYNPATTAPNFTASTSATAGVLTVKDVPVFSALTASQSVGYGTPSVSLGGKLSAESGTVFPAQGSTVTATINGLAQTGTIVDTTGDFTITYPVGTNLPISALAYSITYSYAGNGTTMLGANDASTTLTVTKGTPLFTGLVSHTNTVGTTSVVLTGQLSSGVVYPTNNSVVSAKINGATQNGAVTDNNGHFTITYTGVGALAAGTYPITYTYAGNGTTLNAATNASTSLTLNSVVATSRPWIVSFQVSGSNVILSGTNGTPNGPYALCSSTNPMAPLSTWQTNATAAFDANGNFAITNASSGGTAKFYIIKQ